MGKIKYVGTCGIDDENGGIDAFLDIHFFNGQILLLSLKEKQNQPGFEKLFYDEQLFYPLTDGDYVYWRDGPRLSVSDILAIARGK